MRSEQTAETGREGIEGISSARWVAAAVVCVLAAGAVWCLPVGTHVRLVPLLLLLGGAVLSLAERLTRGSYARRRLLFIGLMLFPVLLLSAELALRVLDRYQARRTAALRLSPEQGGADQSGLMIKHPKYDYQLVPEADYELWGGRVAVDAHGFRTPLEIGMNKPADTLRIMLTGGSSAFGWLVPDGQTITDFLLRALQDDSGGRHVEVINAAVPYYTSYQELRWYRHMLSRFEPDVLIVLDGRNDARNAIVQGRRWRPASEGGIGETPFYQPEDMAAGGTLSDRVGRVLLHSSLYRRVYGVARRLELPWQKEPPPDAGVVDPRFAEQLADHWRTLAAEAQGNGTCIVLALQPVIHVGKELTPEERRRAEMWGGIGPAVRAVWPLLRRAAAGVEPGRGLVVDLTEVFAGFQGEAYLDECHYSVDANRIIADRLAEAVLRCPPPATTFTASP